MEMTGEQLIPATQAHTWEALNDTEMLRACVPGCESITATGPDEYAVLMTARVGPVSAKFKGKMKLSDIRPPESYNITFEGQGGVAGFAKGSSAVQLASVAGGTMLSYQVKANVGGKLAQIGSRLVDAAAQKVSGDFFNAFNEKVAAKYGKPVDHGGGGPGAHPPGDHDAQDDHHPTPVPRDPDLPDVPPSTLAFVAATALVVVAVALIAIF
jgi:carbon monoxide dehydrogenase subunit G